MNSHGSPTVPIRSLVLASSLAATAAQARRRATNEGGREVFRPCPAGLLAHDAGSVAVASGGLRRSPPDAAGFVDLVDPLTGRVAHSVTPPGSRVDGRTVCSEVPR